ncbi:MAG: hypothetical protein GY820_37235 [Gammaproteobacteria bacterium]|nr:hypothetical protein [Gammaproteobacteria bacterium]
MVRERARCAASFEWANSCVMDRARTRKFWTELGREMDQPSTTTIRNWHEALAAFAQITAEMRQKTMLSYRERMEKVIENDGGHVEIHN